MLAVIAFKMGDERGVFSADFLKSEIDLGEHFREKIDHNFRFSWRSSLRCETQSRGNSSYGYIEKIARHVLNEQKPTETRRKRLY